MDVEAASVADPARTRVVAERLETNYGRHRWSSHGEPIDELVGTILSQHTSDQNTARAFASLKEVFPRWEAVAAAATGDVAEAIRMGGLANIKAARIQAALAHVQDRFPDGDMSSLRQLSVGEARSMLTEIPGVGPKTASCILLFALGMPANPVDTHVHRVAWRIGLIPANTRPEPAHDLLETSLGTNLDTVYSFHINMISHGRSVCRARSPRCDRCVMLDLCDFGGHQA
jgi:endonuclease-3